MSWTIRLAKEAAKQLKGVPADKQKLLRRRLHEMQEDPLQGDVKPLQGKEWHGWYRKRVGRYRIIFTLDPLSRSSRSLLSWYEMKEPIDGTGRCWIYRGTETTEATPVVTAGDQESVAVVVEQEFIWN